MSVARALSKLGICSRSEGERHVRDGRVTVNGVTVLDIGRRVHPDSDTITLDGDRVARSARVYLALNKPRGLVTTRHDPQQRATIYDCLSDPSLPFVGAVGRLDKASEGLLLLSNDTQWAARITDPESHVDKTYHVQVRLPSQMEANDALVQRVAAGVQDPESGELLRVKQVSLLRVGSRSGAWLEVVLDEGRNRHIRRIMEALDLEVLRLMRVSIGPLLLGALAKGAWRHLTAAEARALAEASRR